MSKYIFPTLALLILSTQAGIANSSSISRPEPGQRTFEISSVFTNDFLGDGDDRWRTGSIDISLTFGGNDQRKLPDQPWERHHIRLRSEIITPSNLRILSATDRQYAGVIGLGYFTHFQKRDYNIYYGGELIFVGENTGVGDFQDAAHDAVGAVRPSTAVLNNQISNAIYPTGHAGISRGFKGVRSLILPFAEAQAGAETFFRVGADFIIGSAMVNDFLLRDSVTGQLVSHSKADESRGFGFLFGADAAFVADSNYLPSSGPLEHRIFRPRVRAGAIYQAKKFDVFYGATWLGKEFEEQTESQVTGTINFRLRF